MAEVFVWITYTMGYKFMVSSTTDPTTLFHIRHTSPMSSVHMVWYRFIGGIVSHLSDASFVHSASGGHDPRVAAAARPQSSRTVIHAALPLLTPESPWASLPAPARPLFIPNESPLATAAAVAAMLAHHCHRRERRRHCERGRAARDDVALGAWHRAWRSVDSVRRTDTEAENGEGQRGGRKGGRKRRRRRRGRG